jgi:4,5-dihydroxyphthalate decarboxylase
MAPLPLTLACGPYDRTRALADGRVPVEGADLRYIALDPEEIFFRMLGHGEFDASELSLSSYLLTHLAGGPMGGPISDTASPLIAIPVFPSRSFRHSGVYVRDESGVTKPEDLAGRTVGVAEYQLTANVWIRGILQEYHGVPARSVRYRTGGLNEPGRQEKIPLDLPPDIDVRPIPPGETLAALLARGEIDAIYSPRAPIAPEGARLRRLFADPRQAEQDYYRASGVFPVMHVVVLRRRLYESNRWLAQSLMKSFEKAKSLAYADLQRTAALAVTLPWVREEYQATVELLGPDYWSYGLAPNRHVLETFIRYAGQQGMITRPPDPAELFAPETLHSVII